MILKIFKSFCLQTKLGCDRFKYFTRVPIYEDLSNLDYYDSFFSIDFKKVLNTVLLKHFLADLLLKIILQMFSKVLRKPT